MKFFARKFYQRVSLVTLSAVLSISSFSAALPLFLSQTANAIPNSVIVSTPSSVNGWGTQDGSPTYVSGPSGADGNGSLALSTDTLAKEDYFHSAGNVPLATVSGLGYKLDTTAGVPASYQLQVNGVHRTDSASTFTSLVWEPVYNGQVNGPNGGFVSEINLEGGVWWSSHPIDGDTLGNNGFVSLQAIIDANPNATISAYGVNVGSGTPNATSYVDDVAFEGTTTNFEVDPLAAPTNLRFQFQYDATPLTSNYLNVTAKSGGNNLELLWDAPTGTVAGYHIYETYPDGSAAPSPAYQGPNTNAWLNLNGFGQHGQGAYTYQVVAVDTAGNEGIRSTVATLYYDTVAPVVTVNPVAGSFLHGMETFHITVTDADLNPAVLKHVYVYLYNNNPPQKSQGASVDLSSGSGDFTVDTTKLADGLATLDVQRLFDAAGNASGTGDSYFKNYTIDNTAPAVPQLLSPVDGIYRKTADTNSSSWSTVTDINGPVTYYYESAFDSAFTNIAYGPHAQTATSILNPGEPEGTYYWRVMACDSLGNCSAWSTARSINIDNSLPSAPTNTVWANHVGDILGAYTNVNLVTPEWTAPTTGSAVDHYEYEYTSPTDSNWSAPASFTGTSIPDQAFGGSGNNGVEGSWDFRVRTVNRFGDISAWTTAAPIIYDKTAPVVDITSQSNGDVLHGTNVTMSGTVSDTNPDHYYFVVKDSHGNVVAGPGTVNQAQVSDWTWNTKLIADGTYTIDLEARDAANNKDASSVETVTVTVDNTKPNIQNLNLSDALLNLSDANPTLTADLSDATSNVVSAKYKIVDDTTSTTSVGWTDLSASDSAFDSQSEAINSVIDVSTLLDGNYTLSLRTYDTAGNAKTKSITFTIDRSAPTVTIDIPSVTLTNNATPTINGTYASNDSNNDTTVTISVDGSAAQAVTNNGDGTWSFTTSSNLSPDGTHTFVATASDAAGNNSTPSNELSLLIDTTAPNVSVGAYSTNGNVITPTVTANDPNGPLTYMWTANDTASSTNITINDAITKEPNFTVNADGTYKFNLVVTDAAGNPSAPQLFTFTYVTPTTPATPATNVPISNTPTNGTGFTNVTAPADQGVLGTSTQKTGGVSGNTNTDVKGASTKKSNDAGTLWGLAWYWWILILAAIAAIIWWIIAAARRRSAEA